MQILSAASAFPKYYYSQDVLCRALEEYWGDKLENPALMRRLQRRTGVEGRYLSLPLHAYAKLATWGETNNLWIQTAIGLGKQAVCRALNQAGFSPRDLGAIFFTSVTGISSPSIDALLINRMGLSPNIRRIPMFGLGCVAGAAGVSRAADYVNAYPSQLALLLSVELCSLTLQRGDLSVANLISAGLFGDGAAAVILAGADCDLRASDVVLGSLGVAGPKILATRSVFYPETEKMMGWAISEKGFRIVLSREVPNLVRQRLGGDVDFFLSEAGYLRSDIRSWVLHTGGPKVLEATQAALGLEDGQLDASWHCQRTKGNLSSASVLLVLEEVMKNRRPEAGTLGLLAAMGPGFCSELVLLQW
jgi:alkylresorcinol/alkylpyrone synthase